MLIILKIIADIFRNVNFPKRFCAFLSNFRDLLNLSKLLHRMNSSGYHEIMVKAVFPGTFDPPTYGHLNIISRSAVLFDSLDIVIAVNQEKSPLLSSSMRLRLLSQEIQTMELDNVRVQTWDKLIVDYCQSIGAKVLLRGVRSAGDFNYEFELSILNRQLDADIETFMLPTEPKYFVLRSSTIKELLTLKGDISTMVPPSVESALKSLYGA